MKIIVIGTNHAGTTAVRTLKRLNPESEITTYDRNDCISFLGCGIALWVKGEVKNPEDLFYANPDLLAEEGINVKMNHEWVGIDAANKTVAIKDLKTGNIFNDNYDKLIVATGSWPLIPPIPGIDQKGIQICKNYEHGKLIAKANENPEIKHVTIIGAGYIGVELVDAFISKGKKVTLIDLAPRIMPNYYDANFTDQIEKRMSEKGVELQLNKKVTAFKGENGICNTVVTDQGEIQTDYVIFSVGVKPQTDLLKNVITLLPNGGIKTNEYLQSSNPDIYAIGDCVGVYNEATNLEQPIQLATTAVRTGIVAAINIIKNNVLKAPAFTSANGIDVFDIKMASTGLTEEMAKRLNIEVETIFFTDKDRPEFMSSQKDVAIKIVWDKHNRRILGAQIASENNHTETMYMFALAIQKNLTIDELPLVDIFFLPHFNKPYNFITLAALEVLGLNYFKKDNASFNI